MLSIWEAGLPYITQYMPEDYKAHAQNWCFLQDENGIMYAGNTSGILEFDGVSWHLIQLPNGSPAKSLAQSTDSTIYVGAVRDLGFLQPDTLGQLQFQSLLPQLDTAYQDFADIWFTYAVADTIYFISDHYIFRWYNHDFKVWKAQESFGFASKVNDQIYIQSSGIGIMQLRQDSLLLIPDGERFAKGGITTLLPYENGQILAAHFLEGLILYDHHQFVPLKKGEKNVLHKKYVYTGVALPNGSYAFPTAGHGCFIVDKLGNVRQWLSKKRGLSSDVILGCYVDREGSLWMASENGISRLEISSPLRVFNQQSGISESIDRVVYHHGQLYVAANNGVFYLQEISSEPEKKDYYFQKIEEINHQTRDIIAKGKFLLAGNFNGTYQIDPNHRVQALIPENTADLCPSQLDTNRVYVGSTFGNLYALQFVNTQWKAEKSSVTLEGRIMKIVENPNGSLWISTRYNGVYRIDWAPSNTSRTFDKDYTLTYYDTLHGLPEISYNVVFQVKSEAYFSTQAGIYRFNSADQKFEPDTALMNQMGTSMGFDNIIQETAGGGMWITTGANAMSNIYRYEAGLLHEVDVSKRFSDFSIYDIYERNNIVFFSGNKGSVVYHQQLDKNNNISFPVNLRSITTNNDSLLFAGHFSKQLFNDKVRLPFRRNAIRFIFALPSYDKPEANRYQYFLEGFDEDWSSWSAETQRDFTNLPEGDYYFRVRGQNVYGQISEEAVYAFTILPPWYRTWWAYVGYALALACFVGWVVQWRSARLRREKEALENIVRERTQQLEEQAEQLKEMDQMKSRLFANISHEFRTPLSLIKGPVDELVKKREEKIRLSDARMIDRNADRLLRLVNQLLDLSRLDAGNLELEPETGDIFQFLRAMAAAFSSHAEQRGMRYRIEIPQDPLNASFDPDKVEKIVYNLLSNAFKFTPDEGEVIVIASERHAQLALKIKDSGWGIAPEQLPHIFDRFYQTDSSTTREQEGTGIGLALTQELVALMNGEIDVQSEPGKGTTFTVTLPLSLAESDEKELSKEEISKSAPYRSPILAEEEEPMMNGKQEELAMVLVVEDNADMRTFIKGLLHEDFNILEATNGKSGLEIARQEVPDLIITDLMMPQMDGKELCQLLKTDERTSHIPVVMLTAKAGQAHKIEGLETGADDYLTKPFDRQELQVRIKNLITQRQALRKRFSREVLLEPKQVAITSLDEQFLQKVMDHMEKHLSDPAFGVPQLQDLLAMSKTQLYRKMKALTDESPGEFIRHCRLKRAAQILARQGENVTQVAYAVGFNNLSYFAKCFKELYGVAPSAYTGQPFS